MKFLNSISCAYSWKYVASAQEVMSPQLRHDVWALMVHILTVNMVALSARLQCGRSLSDEISCNICMHKQSFKNL